MSDLPSTPRTQHAWRCCELYGPATRAVQMMKFAEALEIELAQAITSRAKLELLAHYVIDNPSAARGGGDQEHAAWLEMRRLAKEAAGASAPLADSPTNILEEMRVELQNIAAAPLGVSTREMALAALTRFFRVPETAHQKS